VMFRVNEGVYMRVISLSLTFMLLAVLMPLSVQAQTQQTLDNAVRDGARYLQGRFPRGTRAAIVAVQGENREIGEFVVRQLGEVLVNANWFTIVERDAAALATIERETDRHMNFYVSQETEIFIGRQLGAEVIISGSMTRSGANWRLEVHAVTVETAQRVAQWSAANIRPDPGWAALASPRSAGLAFAGDSLSARDRQVVAGGLRSAMQSRNVSLDLDENAAGAGYVFTVTVFREQLPASPPANTALLRIEATIAFSQGGRILFQAGPYHITEMTEAMAMRRVAERIANDGAFFDRINAALR